MIRSALTISATVLGLLEAPAARAEDCMCAMVSESEALLLSAAEALDRSPTGPFAENASGVVASRSTLQAASVFGGAAVPERILWCFSATDPRCYPVDGSQGGSNAWPDVVVASVPARTAAIGYPPKTHVWLSEPSLKRGGVTRLLERPPRT